MWLTMLNDRIRLTSSWAMAPRMPITIVSPASTSSSVAGRSSAPNSSVWVRIRAYTPTLVSSPANTAVTADGATG